MTSLTKQREHSTGDDLKRVIEKIAHEFTFGNSKTWAKLPEAEVIKLLRLWVKLNHFTDSLHIYVDPISTFRYRLVPDWRLKKYLQDHDNVYTYPLEPE
jgi:hypothetical protein